MLIATKLLELLQQNIDSLNIPNILKKALKKLKERIFKQARATVAAASRAQAATAAPPAAAAAAAVVAPVVRPTPRGRTGRPRRQVAGVKNVEGRVRNKRFKIKRILPQPRKIEVKKRCGEKRQYFLLRLEDLIIKIIFVFN